MSKADICYWPGQASALLILPISCPGSPTVTIILPQSACSLQTQGSHVQVGGHLLARMRELQSRHDIIGDVRGRGLMLGVEMVADRGTKAPATAETGQVGFYWIS